MIDTHAHLHLINQPTKDVLAEAARAGVSHVIQVAIDMDSVKRNINEFDLFDRVSITGGIHPLSVTDDLVLDDVIHYLESNIDRFVAIGETGLDYKYGNDNKQRQIYFFNAQLDLARRFNKPVVIHSRHSDEDMLSIVNEYPDVKKVFHCYATNLDFYQSLTGELNYVSFTGMITYAKRGKVVHALKHIPIDRIMIETDSPYLIPKGIESDQNRPEFVGEVAHYMAGLRGVRVADIKYDTTRNAMLFFSLDD